MENKNKYCKECEERSVMFSKGSIPNPHKDYSDLTIEEKQYYADILNSIFKGTVGIVQVHQVTPNVARAADFFMEEILNCAQRMKAALYIFVPSLAVNMIFDIYLGGGKKKSQKSITQIIAEELPANYLSTILTVIYDNFAYRTCINKVNVNWKSQMGLLLYGIIDDLSY